ncbi:bifunctional diguanylate cyclase/phosphodiesterase [Bacillus sp. RO1]|uniref:putative bifunctional diguanylate cyclase/phosphodiesterase n=1 Tax=Bacillus sp. RO1 TaxID=2722703 RepID=UPI0014577574|nr:bifunctional diguanylate cyclase/phosphodiesterase [Bacillus sp. RO1]NLP52161.1 EAL domain-containing protein [Bacillus sp. RO1]
MTKFHWKLLILISSILVVIIAIGLFFKILILRQEGYNQSTILYFVGITAMITTLIISFIYQLLGGLNNSISRLIQQVQTMRKGTGDKITESEKWNGLRVLQKNLDDLSNSLEHLKAKEMKLNFHLTHDQLTGLPNKTKLHQKLVALQKEENPPFIIMVDIHGFKVLNDTYGKEAGDYILIEAGRRIESAAPIHFVARVSSDQFCIVTNQIKDKRDAQSLVARIKTVLLNPYNFQREDIRIDIAVGISKCDTDDVESSLTRATIALFSSKSKGRGQVEFYVPAMSEHQTEKMRIENKLHQAVANKEIYLEYQPKVSLISGKTIGVEALARWIDAHLGSVPPNHFIPIAEETGLITTLTRDLLMEACKRAYEWNTRDTFIPISVNLSPILFTLYPELDKFIEEALKESQLNPGLLEIEITEGVLLSKGSVDVLQKICDLGVTISVDDFGTGYSSLGYLKDFPIHTLKIDKSFIQIIRKDKTNRELAESILFLGKKLGLQVVAEGVETKEQLQFLMEKGCDAIQGYYISKPLPLKDLHTFLNEDYKVSV